MPVTFSPRSFSVLLGHPFLLRPPSINPSIGPEEWNRPNIQQKRASRKRRKKSIFSTAITRMMTDFCRSTDSSLLTISSTIFFFLCLPSAGRKDFLFFVNNRIFQGKERKPENEIDPAPLLCVCVQWIMAFENF